MNNCNDNRYCLGGSRGFVSRTYTWEWQLSASTCVVKIVVWQCWWLTLRLASSNQLTIPQRCATNSINKLIVWISSIVALFLIKIIQRQSASYHYHSHRLYYCQSNWNNVTNCSCVQCSSIQLCDCESKWIQLNAVYVYVSVCVCRVLSVKKIDEKNIFFFRLESGVCVQIQEKKEILVLVACSFVRSFCLFCDCECAQQLIQRASQGESETNARCSRVVNSVT